MAVTTRGSVWRKWDLHVHTPYSIEQNYGGDHGWDTYLTALENLHPDIKVLGINDYIFIDGYARVLKEKTENGRLQNIDLLIPVVELRIDKFGNLGNGDPFKRVNFHIIFSPELSPEIIQQQFLNSLTSIYKVDAENDSSSYWGGLINRESIIDLGNKIIASSGGRIAEGPLKVGFNSLNVSYEQLLQKLNNSYLSGKYLTAVGKTEWDAMRWDGSIADKKDIINRANIVFSASQTVNAALVAKQKLAEQNVNSNLLHCSDAHTYLMENMPSRPNDLGHCFTWIKADTTFEGLKQIIYEPQQRVSIQDREPDFKEDKLVIDCVSFTSAEDKFTPKVIYLNKNLNVIIGGKSSGKSILLHCIAKTLLADRSILKTEGRYRYNFGEDFDFTVQMKSGLTQSIKRDDEQPSILSEIKYIPQNYLSKLAEPENKKGNELLKLVRELLLEDEEYKLKYTAFIETLKANDRRRELLINNYFEIKDKIKTLQADLIARGNEEALTLNISSNEEKVNTLKQGIGLTPEQIVQYNQYNGELQKLEIEVNSVRTDHAKISSFNKDASTIIGELINKKKLALASIENAGLKTHFEKQYAILDTVAASLTEVDKATEIGENRRFTDPNSIFNLAFQSKAKRKKELEELLLPFLKNEEIKKQIEALEKFITEDKQKLSVINQIKTDISKNHTALDDEKTKIFALYRENYDEYTTIIGEIAERASRLKDDNLEIQGTPKYNFPKLRKAMFAISDGRRINYASYPIYNEELTATSEYEIEEFIAAIDQIFVSIANGTYPLSSKSDSKHAIKLIMGDNFFDYWNVVYDGDTLDKMSTGKASFVILMLIVGLSISQAPILIDQPEDNLDNRSITKDLVTYLRNKKHERQIIVVTHNPNVVVNADAENIIVANQHGQNDIETSSPYQFDYINGSLENTSPYNKEQKDILLSMGIKEHIADIVEGGKEAFKKREKKYGFIDASLL
jgi:ABC-type cobalamin/Fe3+-siderophores transport system ATPase subunit